ncbi:MAG: hypothetical protein LBU32_28025 [Clostridiales bacterium]|nr:hypothetical protein [Clostridiales bacterium]
MRRAVQAEASETLGILNAAWLSEPARVPDLLRQPGRRRLTDAAFSPRKRMGAADRLGFQLFARPSAASEFLVNL